MFSLCSRASLARICRRASCFANSQLIGAKSGLLAVPAQRDPAANEPFFKAAAVDFRLFLLQSPFYSPIIPQLHAQLPLWHLKRGPVSPEKSGLGPLLSVASLCIADPPEKPLMILDFKV